MATGQESTSQREDEELRGRRGSERRGQPAHLLSALEQAKRSFETAVDDVRERVHEKPVKTLALAVGAGYVVGGGLFTPLSGRLFYTGLRIALRLAALPLVREELMALVETISDRGRGEQERRHQQ
jgi:ElaB/YqjD/DUF883 family membrane-anchored ribosome-binding protein